MSFMSLNKSIVKNAALTSFDQRGYSVGHEPLLSAGEPSSAQDSVGEILLMDNMSERRLFLNPITPQPSA